MSDFVHLHLHTEYSLLDGACRIDELLDQAARLKMPALAVTEHGNMFSSVIFHDHARQRGVKPILGCEVYVAPGSRHTKSGTIGETANHLVLLAETNEGYHNLIKLVSAGYTEGFYYKPRIDKELLSQHATGLIGLSSCLKGEVAEGLSHAQDKKARDAAASYKDILGAQNFFLEMQWHGIEEQRIVNGGIPAIAKDLGLGLVCTNDVHYLRDTDAHPHDILLCIGTGKAFSDPKRLRYEARQFFLKSPDQMADAFRDHPDALANTVRIAERCHVTLPEGENYLPDIDIDFCERRRGEVIEYVTRKYGRENVAQIITFGTMKAKAVVRDVGRVLEMPFGDVDKVAKQIPAALDMTLDKALDESEPLRQMEQNDPKVKELLNVARRLEGMTRHASVHAAGVVIAPKAITEYAPLYRAQAGEDRGEIRAAGARADPLGHLRRHRLPGTGDAHLERRRRLHARRGRHSPQGDGEEEGRRDAEDARLVRAGGEEERHVGKESRLPVRADGALRRIRLQQVSLDGLRVPGVSDGVSQSELPSALRRVAPDDRGGEHRQARLVSR